MGLVHVLSRVCDLTVKKNATIIRNYFWQCWSLNIHSVWQTSAL